MPVERLAADAYCHWLYTSEEEKMKTVDHWKTNDNAFWILLNKAYCIQKVYETLFLTSTEVISMTLHIKICCIVFLFTDWRHRYSPLSAKTKISLRTTYCTTRNIHSCTLNCGNSDRPWRGTEDCCNMRMVLFSLSSLEHNLKCSQSVLSKTDCCNKCVTSEYQFFQMVGEMVELLHSTCNKNILLITEPEARKNKSLWMLAVLHTKTVLHWADS